MVTISQIIADLLEHEIEFNRIYKCLNKTKQNKKEITESHFNNIIKEYNCIKSTYIGFHHLIDNENQLYLLQTLEKSHIRLLKLFKLYKLHIQIPDIKFSEVNTPIDSGSDSDNQENMAKSAIEFINFATKTIPEFDGSSEELRRFVDAITLIKANVGEFEATAVEVVKTKLKGTARNFITNEATLQAIVDNLKSNIKPESTTLIISKLNNLKQFGKSANAYIKELEDLTTSLKRAFITEGVPIETAETYTATNAVTAMKSNEIK